MARDGVTGVLLVGGASRRFGDVKALAPLDGETLAARAWRVLGECCDERLAVGKVADALPLPFPVVDDESPVRAPLAGLVTGLRRAQHDVAVVLPVDTPLVTVADLRALADACRDAAVVRNGPLPGAYRKRVLPQLEQALADGRLALRELVATLDAPVVDVPAERLANVNTPADLDALAPSIVELRPEHAGEFRGFVERSLADFGFSVDPALDADLADPAHAYVAAWVVLDQGTVAGSVVLIDRPAGSVFLRRMYLAPALRGRGLGRALLELALDWARDHGYRSVRLDTTDAMVAARALYESVGFRVIGEGAPRSGRRRIEYELSLAAPDG